MPLDGIRAIAVLWVMLSHVKHFALPSVEDKLKFDGISNIIDMGGFGVDLFFVLSGFLIGFILFKECKKYEGKLDMLLFYTSRFFRIWPVLCFFILFILTRVSYRFENCSS